MTGQTPLDSARAQTNADLREMVTDYREFQLCREMGLTLDQLRGMPSDTIRMWMVFLDAEKEAERYLVEKAKQERR